MFQESQICPYTGLRSFTEEESLYFKGREEDIDQATLQLQRNKFLMLTGASGDGKSSLVYAGIVPNARAGFLKAKYSQWCVADFRPERSPFRNLCKAVARQLDISNTETVEAELRYGFSALIDLYTNSKRYVDTESVQWQQADDKQKGAIKREAANLIILVDQFEEFFTNPENYTRGIPSTDSNIVLNLLLETARIALEQDLPVYVIFTMRSDYIGQCAAFRELPEYIGFSQFFVPRLNRAQLQQIIEEPAVLSGNRISRRLTERLIHDIAEGVDQLPIIQHALNQIWHAASNGQEEMDLIHYAMTGGMPESELPDDQRKKFATWFSDLPEKIKACYQEPNLQNVLDTHANKLFESAGEHYRNATGKSIADDLAKSIIKTTFTCLTKIDQSRAVRNRMSLKEITLILNNPDVTTETTAGVLHIFREPGNTFIRPFITEDESSEKLGDDDVLDITHESLIRNWELLEAWAKEEFDNFTISLDFKRQLDRWVESGKSNDFLLSIGPLTYFETWYNKVKPNAWWIARYLPEDADDARVAHSNKILENGTAFLKRSARKHAITRVVMRYGPKRIAAVIVLLIVVVIAAVGLRNYLTQRNDYVLKDIEKQAVRLASSKTVAFYQKSILLAQLVKLDKLSIGELTGSDQPPLEKLNTISHLLAVFVFQGGKEPAREIMQSMAAVDSLLYSIRPEDLSGDELNALVSDLEYLLALHNVAIVYDDNEKLKEYRKHAADRAAQVVLHILKTQPEDFTRINIMHLCLEYGITYHSFSDEELNFIRQTISPFGDTPRSAWVLRNYDLKKIAKRGFYDYGFWSNGLYQEMAYLNATSGNTKEALQCIDTLMKYNQNYFQQDYASNIDNASTIAIVFYSYGKINQLNEFVAGYTKRRKVSEVEFYQRLVGRSVIGDYVAQRLADNEEYWNLNNSTGAPVQHAFFFSQLRKAIQSSKSSNDEFNFNMALAYKDEAIIRNLTAKLQGNKPSESLDSLLDRAFMFYSNVSKPFLESYVMAARTNDIDARLSLRKSQFLYPDYRTTFAPFEGRNYQIFYTSELFVDYLLRTDKLERYYTDADLTNISSWVMSAYSGVSYSTNGRAFLRLPVGRDLLTRLVTTVEARKNVSRYEFTGLYMMTGNSFYKVGNAKEAHAYYSKIDFDRFPEFFFAVDNSFELFYEVAICFQGLVTVNDWTRANGIARAFKNSVNRSSLYAFAALRRLESNSDDTLAQRLLDSARHELTRIENLNTGQPNRQIIAGALAFQNPHGNLPEVYKTIRNIYDKASPTGVTARAFAQHGELYEAREQMAENISDSDLAAFLWNVVYGYSLSDPTPKPEWEEFNKNHFAFLVRTIYFQDEDN